MLAQLIAGRRPMARRIRKLALLSALVGACAVPAAGMAQAPELKDGFNCGIDLPESAERVFTYDSARVCAATYISVTCRRQVTDPEEVFTDPELECRIDPSACGLSFPELEDSDGFVPATRAKLSIDASGTARLNCLFAIP
jgi:hypothetical protein